MKTTITITERKDGTIKYEARFTCDRASRSECAPIDYEALEASEAARTLDVPEVGAVYMVAESMYVGPNGDCNPRIHWHADNGEGWGGNSNDASKRYHGWRGTTDGWSFTGLGVRKCLKVYRTGIRSKRVVVIFGKDLKRAED